MRPATPSASGIWVFVLSCLGFIFLALVLSHCQGCQTWTASVEKPVDFTKPVEEIPAQFRVGIGGTF